MKLFTQTKPKPLALLATRSKAVLSDGLGDEFRVCEVVSTLGALHLLEENPALVVADVADLVECPQFSRRALASTLQEINQERAVIINSKEFLAERDRWVGQALLNKGRRSGIRYLPPRVVMVTNYCGGVGKTTLSLAAARDFHRSARLPAAIVEAGVGASSLNARLGSHTTLYNIITQRQSADRWEGVDVYPLDDWEARVLAGDERTPDALADILHDHTLTVFDVFPTSPLWEQALRLATDVIVVAAPRQDALAQAEAVIHRLKDDTGRLGVSPSVHLAANLVRSAGERIAMAGQSSAWVAYDERRAARIDPSLGIPLLELAWPGWRKDGRQ